VAMNTSTTLDLSASVDRVSKAQRVANQALWYVAAFYLTFLFPTINRVVEQVTSQTYFPLVFLHAITKPMQGLLNYLVYIRPRFLKIREQNPELPFWKIGKMMIEKTAQHYVSHHPRVPSMKGRADDSEDPRGAVDQNDSDEWLKALDMDEAQEAREELMKTRERLHRMRVLADEDEPLPDENDATERKEEATELPPPK